MDLERMCLGLMATDRHFRRFSKQENKAGNFFLVPLMACEGPAVDPKTCGCAAPGIWDGLYAPSHPRLSPDVANDPRESKALPQPKNPPHLGFFLLSRSLVVVIIRNNHSGKSGVKLPRTPALSIQAAES